MENELENNSTKKESNEITIKDSSSIQNDNNILTTEIQKEKIPKEDENSIDYSSTHNLNNYNDIINNVSNMVIYTDEENTITNTTIPTFIPVPESTLINDNDDNNNPIPIIPSTLPNTASNSLILDDSLNATNITNNTLDKEKEANTNSFITRNYTIPIINKTFDAKLFLGLSILFLAVIVIMTALLIWYCLRKKRKSRMNSMTNDDMDVNNNQNGIKNKRNLYNKLQNTSGLNPERQNNNMSMNEIKMKNLKEEIHSIISNSSASKSSGKRKREKKRGNNNINNNYNFRGNQTEVKEKVKQLVIEENDEKNI